MAVQTTLFEASEAREFHPLTQILPPVSASEDVISAIAAAFSAGSNFLEYRPITLDHEGRIVDGRLRYLACRRAGVEPVYEVLGAHYTDRMILSLIMSKNYYRQHLTEGQCAFVALAASADGGQP